MPATYTHTTLQQLIDQVLSSLHDSAGVFFTSQEVQFALYEALTVWNQLTGFYRTTASFQTTAGQPFYDLSSVLSGNPLTSNITVRDVLGRMQYRLLEPYDPLASAGVSEMFTHADLVRSIQQRRDRFLAETETVITQPAPIAVGLGDGAVPLDDHTVSIVRAVWKTQENRYYSVEVTDETAATAFLPSWRQSDGLPRYISVSQQPQLNAQLFPPLLNPGTLELFTIQSGTALDTAANTPLDVMDDTAWAVGWGAMADLLLHDGIGRAPELAQFCEQMYRLGAALARQLPCVLGATINNRMIATSTIEALDKFRPGWQGRNRDVPTIVAIIGDTVALHPVPDAEYSVGINLVRTTPQPALGENVQLGREQLAAIVSWAKQLLLFKKGGAQLEQGVMDSQSLFRQARIYNESRILSSSYLTEMYSQSSTDPWVPLRSSSSSTGVAELDAGDGRDNASTRQPRQSRKRLGGK